MTHLAKPVRGGERLTIGNTQLIPIELKHDVPCIGLYIRNQYKETVLWVSDTSEIPVDIEADVYVIEANYDEDTLDERGQAGEVEIGVYGRLISDWGHMSAQAASRYIQKNAKPDSVVILQHVSQNNGYSIERAKEIFGREVLIAPAEFEWGAKCPF